MSRLAPILTVAPAAVLLGLGAPAPAATAQVSLDEHIPLGPAVTTGELDNGLRYYVRANGRPENRAEFRLVVNVGSILEDDGQRGLAHLVEHMAFNGTEHFEKQELVDYLESIGMEFGPSVNAYTSFDETVYMLEVPTDDPEIMATAFQILEDWAHGVAFEPEESESLLYDLAREAGVSPGTVLSRSRLLRALTAHAPATSWTSITWRAGYQGLSGLANGVQRHWHRTLAECAQESVGELAACLSEVLGCAGGHASCVDDGAES